MKLPVLWSGLCCYTVKCSEILATKLLYNPRVNKVFTFTHGKAVFSYFKNSWKINKNSCVDYFFTEMIRETGKFM